MNMNKENKQITSMNLAQDRYEPEVLQKSNAFRASALQNYN